MLKRVLFTVIMVIFCTMAYAAIIYDASSSTQGTADTFLFEHTTGTGDFRMLVFSILMEGTPSVTVSSATYGGEALTEAITTYEPGGSDGVTASIWYLPDPPTGANPLQVTITAASSAVMGVATYFGVDALGNTMGYSATADLLAFNFPITELQSWVMGIFGQDYGGTYYTPGTGISQRWVQQTGTEPTDVRAAGYDFSGADSLTPVLQYTSDQSAGSIMMAAEFLEMRTPTPTVTASITATITSTITPVFTSTPSPTVTPGSVLMSSVQSKILHVTIDATNGISKVTWDSQIVWNYSNTYDFVQPISMPANAIIRRSYSSEPNTLVYKVLSSTDAATPVDCSTTNAVFDVLIVTPLKTTR